VLEALVRTAAEGPGLEHDVATRPEVPDPETLEKADDLAAPDAPRHAFWRNLEARVIASERFRERRARPPRFLEWYRFRPRATFDDAFVDAGRLLLLVDTMSWPAAVQPHVDSPFIAPNLEVSVWFHRFDPASDWLLAEHDCPVAERGLMGTHGRIWSRDGRLLATGGAQLLCVPAPGGG
jgi:acyl-CoA thioesterase-2